jgi:hypothetical protein
MSADPLQIETAQSWMRRPSPTRLRLIRCWRTGALWLRPQTRDCLRGPAAAGSHTGPPGPSGPQASQQTSSGSLPRVMPFIAYIDEFADVLCMIRDMTQLITHRAALPMQFAAQFAGCSGNEHQDESI